MNKDVRMVRLQQWINLLQQVAASGIPKCTWCD